jgi:hypothetical protein
MAASMDDPLLIDYRSDLVAGHRAGVRSSPLPGFRAFDVLASRFRLDEAFGVM